jgi:hypothetical protein
MEKDILALPELILNLALVVVCVVKTINLFFFFLTVTVSFYFQTFSISFFLLEEDLQIKKYMYFQEHKKKCVPFYKSILSIFYSFSTI